jgi:hypothetical protein
MLEMRSSIDYEFLEGLISYETDHRKALSATKILVEPNKSISLVIGDR